jgi:hypothetical protein
MIKGTRIASFVNVNSWNILIKSLEKNISIFYLKFYNIMLRFVLNLCQKQSTPFHVNNGPTSQTSLSKISI